MRTDKAIPALAKAVRLARLEIECYYDDRCRGTPEGTIKRLSELLGNKEIGAAMEVLLGEQDSPSIVPQESSERHHA